MSNETKLNSCPFCGSSDVQRIPYLGRARCESCGASAPVDAWNLRATDSRAKEIDALYKRLCLSLCSGLCRDGLCDAPDYYACDEKADCDTSKKAICKGLTDCLNVRGMNERE